MLGKSKAMQKGNNSPKSPKTPCSSSAELNFFQQVALAIMPQSLEDIFKQHHEARIEGCRARGEAVRVLAESTAFYGPRTGVPFTSSTEPEK